MSTPSEQNPLPIGVALFGSGRIGQVHAANVAARTDATLRWVCDPRVEAAEGLAAAHGAAWTRDPDQVLADPEVTAVIVASSTPTHMELVLAARAAGKRVLCEKPLDLSLAVVDQAVASSSVSLDEVMVGFNRRFDPSFAEVHRRVSAGEIGTLEQLTIISRDPAAPPAEYIAQSGGLFRDMSIHDLDMARHFLGHIDTVYATGAALFDDGARSHGDIDTASILLTSRSGAQCQIINARRCTFGYEQRLEAFGSLGALHAGNRHDTTVSLHAAGVTGARGPAQPFFLERYAEAYRAELEHFLRSIRDAVVPSPAFADGRAALVLALAAGVSLAERRPVTVSEVSGA